MKKLEDMNILEKATELEKLIAKAELDSDYAIQVAWDDKSPQEVTTYAKTLISNARNLFLNNKIDSLEMDVKTSTYAHYNVCLDNCLKMFPEHAKNDVVTESVTNTHSL